MVVFGDVVLSEVARDIHRVEREGGDAGSDKAEVIATEVPAGRRVGVWTEWQRITPGSFFNERPGVCFVDTEGHQACGFATGDDAIEIDVKTGGGDGEKRVLCIESGTE